MPHAVRPRGPVYDSSNVFWHEYELWAGAYALRYFGKYCLNPSVPDCSLPAFDVEGEADPGTASTK
ncbi:MAG: hypothetical protein P8O12_10145, partial [Tateyamaria sp.]|nr:hypothetical protein [Tateyamaria sp.]